MKDSIKEMKKIYLFVQHEITSRLEEFKRLWRTGTEEDIFAELVFCILTPQSRAKTCWATVKNLLNKNLLLKWNKKQIIRELDGVRFKYKKAGYVVEAGKQFSIDGKVFIKSQIAQFGDAYDARDWLAWNVKGIGYKEAGHFLRNIGLGENLAILDRHVLKNLKLFGIIEGIPDSLSRKKYLEIEKRMKGFAEKIKIPILKY